MVRSRRDRACRRQKRWNLVPSTPRPNCRGYCAAGGECGRQMLALLIIAVVFGIGFGLGYGVRDKISRRRHRHRHRRSDVSPHPKPPPARELQDADTAAHFAMDLDRLLVAANDDLARRRQRPHGGQIVEQRDPPENFDVAVRDLLAELNRRSSQPSASARVQR
jgi:hypothetical protein